MNACGFFKRSDLHIAELAGYKFPPDWWSRPWEYAWAFQFAEPDQVVADMGCGWMYRPFKDALAKMCKFVYAVDADERLHEQKMADNMAFVTADISKKISVIPDRLLDRVFCISVLEDLKRMIRPTLREFARVIKPDGLIVLTFDVQFDQRRPLGPYPGVNLEGFMRAVEDAGLRPSGAMSLNTNDAVVHEDWNLCCYRCVLEKVPERIGV